MYYNKKRGGQLVHLGELILGSSKGKILHGRPIWHDSGVGERVEKFFDLPTRTLKTRSEFLRLQADRAEERRRGYIGGRRSNISQARRAAREELMSATG